MYYLAVATDVIHAVAMILWIIGLPLLFWRKHSYLSLAYATYSLIFIIINQVSHYTLGKCIMTELSQYCWKHSVNHPDTSEWFAVRFSQIIFGLTPTHVLVKQLTEGLICLSAIGGITLSYRKFSSANPTCQDRIREITPPIYPPQQVVEKNL